LPVVKCRKKNDDGIVFWDEMEKQEKSQSRI